MLGSQAENGVKHRADQGPEKMWTSRASPEPGSEMGFNAFGQAMTLGC